MNREIKFRGQRVDNGRLVYGFYWVTSNGTYITHNGNTTHEDSFVFPETIGQFTGREDAEINGKQVYEGDIIENCDTKALQIVYWNNDESAWHCKYHGENRTVSLADSLGNLNKVIGNIFETPALLHTGGLAGN